MIATLISVVAYPVVELRKGVEQSRAAAQLDEMGATVIWHYQLGEGGEIDGRGAPKGPKWMRSIFGNRAYSNVAIVFCSSQMSDKSVVAVNCFPLLRRLSLSGSQITDEGLRKLRDFQQLTSLQLDSMRITDEGLSVVRRQRALKSLSLMKNDVTGANLGIGEHLRQLQHLDLSHTNVALSCVGGSKSLRELTVRGNALGDGGIEAVCELPSLRGMDVSGGTISDKAIAMLLQSDSLESFRMRGIPVSVTVAKAIRESNLRHVDVGSSGFTDDYLQLLEGCKNLRMLDVLDTEVTQEGIERLKHRIPRLQVIGPSCEDSMGVEYFSVCIEDNPNQHWAYRKRALCFYRLGNCERAVKDISEALRIAPKDAENELARDVILGD